MADPKPGLDYVGVAIGAMIFNDQGKVLLTKRGPKARNEVGKWDFPGGAVNFGEKLEDAVKREVREELGIEIEVIEQLETVDHIIPDENQHWISTTYIARYVSGTPKIMEPEKLSEYKLVKLSEINPDDLTIVSQSNHGTYIKKYGANPPKNLLSSPL